jgi:hypothetical protein
MRTPTFTFRFERAIESVRFAERRLIWVAVPFPELEIRFLAVRRGAGQNSKRFRLAVILDATDARPAYFMVEPLPRIPLNSTAGSNRP